MVSQRKHVLLEGSSSLLTVSKPESKKAENKAALCVKAGCSVSVVSQFLTPPSSSSSPSSIIGKDKALAGSEHYYFIARENRDMNCV